MTMRPRSSGLLLHPTSLPGGHGIGDLGPEAGRFLDLLAEAGQTLWQIMPLGPPGYGASPYAARSAFAGNPLLISLDRLAEDGLLETAGLAGSPGGSEDRVDFAAVEAWKAPRLARACDRLLATAAGRQAVDRFQAEQSGWLDDFALFMALRDVHGGSAWTEWEPELVQREPAALKRARTQLQEAVDRQRAAQYLFASQWAAVRAYANGRGIRIIGDVPIFVAHDSADVWARQDVFLLDERGQPTVVAGVPPDLFSETGQRWGNPHYNWERLAAHGFDWWVERFRAIMAQVDIVRIDHFRGFAATWQIPAEEETAVQGEWVETPGRELFAAVRSALGEVPVVAEDLGLITPDVEALRDELGIPGMNVLQFAFGGKADNPYLPHNFQPDTLVYTGTHDNDTTAGWYQSAGEGVRDHVRRYFGVNGHDIAWDLIRAALASVADMAIIPMQDVLALGGEARMNFPGHPQGNWSWRMRPGQFTAAQAGRLRGLSALYGRPAVSDDDEGEEPAGSQPAPA